jgi:hypothetical protein
VIERIYIRLFDNLLGGIKLWIQRPLVDASAFYLTNCTVGVYATEKWGEWDLFGNNRRR